MFAFITGDAIIVTFNFALPSCWKILEFALFT